MVPDNMTPMHDTPTPPKSQRDPACITCTCQQVAVGASGPTRTGRSRSRARQGASSPRRTISPAPAGQPQLPADLAPYEAQVMAVLAMYPGLRLERLHAMMGASTLPPM